MPKKAGKTGCFNSKDGSLLPIGCVKTQKHLSIVFGVTSRCIRLWVKEGLPKSDGFYNIAEVCKWAWRNKKPAVCKK